jgi:putative toxin-antitoxin system antitoxin component (TIGR02293 family)
MSINKVNASKAASPQATYAPREQRLRSERSLFSVLLAQSDPTSEMEVVKLVHNRLPLSVIDRLLAEGVTKQEISLVAPPRTIAHRRANEERLTIDESDRAVRLARVVAQTESVFGNKDKAMAWLRQPMKRFEGNTPIEMLASDVGSRMVEEALVQIDEGFFA